MELRTETAQKGKWQNGVNYYVHTSEDEHGTPLPESSGKWQPLKVHLRNVADLARRFAAPRYPLRLDRRREGELSNLTN
jgi:hypothetical protein